MAKYCVRSWPFLRSVLLRYFAGDDAPHVCWYDSFSRLITNTCVIFFVACGTAASVSTPCAVLSEPDPEQAPATSTRAETTHTLRKIRRSIRTAWHVQGQHCTQDECSSGRWLHALEGRGHLLVHD